MSAEIDVLRVDSSGRDRPTAGELRALCARRHHDVDAVAVIADDGDIAVVEQWLHLLDHADAVAFVDPLTDALQRVDPAGVVIGAVDRSPYGRFGLPQLLRREAVTAAIAEVDDHRVVDPAGAVLADAGVVLAAPRERRPPL